MEYFRITIQLFKILTCCIHNHLMLRNRFKVDITFNKRKKHCLNCIENIKIMI